VSRVLIGIPSADAWKAKCGIGLVAITCNAALSGINVVPASVQQAYINESRNQLARMAIGSHCEYLFMMDDDMMAPPDCLIRLVEYNLDIVGAIYNMRAPPYHTLGENIDGSSDFIHNGIMEMAYIPTGCILIKTKIFKKMKPPWFQLEWKGIYKTETNPDGLLGEDVGFCYKARELGYKVHCDFDLSYQVVHLGEQGIKLDPTIREIQHEGIEEIG